MGGRMAGMALDDFLMPFAAMIATQQLMDAKKRKDQGIVGRPSPNVLQRIGVPTDTRHRNQGISYNPLLMR